MIPDYTAYEEPARFADVRPSHFSSTNGTGMLRPEGLHDLIGKLGLGAVLMSNPAIQRDR